MTDLQSRKVSFRGTKTRGLTGFPNKTLGPEDGKLMFDGDTNDGQ